jgi:hypothetical protein
MKSKPPAAEPFLQLCRKARTTAATEDRSPVKKLVFSWIQPLTLDVIVLFWVLAPESLVDNSWTIVVASSLTTPFILALEFINERPVGWRLNRREFFTDPFYVALVSSVIAKVATNLDDGPLESAKHALGMTTPWTLKRLSNTQQFLFPLRPLMAMIEARSNTSASAVP